MINYNRGSVPNTCTCGKKAGERLQGSPPVTISIMGGLGYRNGAPERGKGGAIFRPGEHPPEDR